jgi:hypothetical protein
MALILDILLGAAFAVAVGGAVHLWRRQRETDRREDLRALAARRGWALTEGGGGLGRKGSLRIVPRGGHPWTLEVRAGDATTDYVSEGPRWTEGRVVLAPVAAEPGDAAVLQGIVRSDRALTPMEAPGGLMLAADADPARRIPLDDVARLLTAWQPVARGQKGWPVLVLSPEGMRLVLGVPLRRADQVERFADLAFALSRVIGP